jgi:6-phosphogluconolactonase (cycloisomerase 2 family)
MRFAGKPTRRLSGCIQFLYLANAPSGRVAAYRINQSSSTLNPVPGFPLTAGKKPVELAVHRSGKFLYVTNYSSKNASAFAIDLRSESLTPVSGSPFRCESEPSEMTMHPSGRFVYVSSMRAWKVSPFAVDSQSHHRMMARRA